MPVTKTLSFTMQRQSQTQWCWAAVASSVVRYYKPKSTMTQCMVANAVLSPTMATYGTTTCCPNKTSCNETAPLDDALTAVSCLNAVWPATDFRFANVQSEINANKPIGGRIEYDDGAGRFVAIVGYYTDVTTTGTHRATLVKDSWYGDTIVVGDVAGYDCGAWTDFYTTHA